MIENNELVDMARQAMLNAYAPYSGFKVGAALLADDGNVYTGCNIENISYGASCCAERTAVFKAVSEGKRKFIRLAIASSGNEPTFPCGICRQVLNEFMPNGEVIIASDRSIEVFTLDELLPHSFNNTF
jgi:cytidine deaminase